MLLIVLAVLYCASVSLAWLVGLRVIEYNHYWIGSLWGASMLLGGVIERCTATRTGRILPATMGFAYLLPIIAATASVFWASGLLFTGLILRLLWLIRHNAKPIK